MRALHIGVLDLFFILLGDISMPKQSENIEKAAIIGGGACGMAAAKVLDQAPDKYNVELFEARDEVGGNARRVLINGVYYDLGPEFLKGPGPKGYPTVHTFLKHLDITPEPFELNMEFHGPDNMRIVLPPLIHNNDDEGDIGCCGFGSFWGTTPKQPKTHIAWKTIFTQFCSLLTTKFFIDKAEELNSPGHETQTLEAFVNDFIQGALIDLQKNTRQHWADNLLYPLLAGAFGVSLAQIKQCCARYAMAYLTLETKWYSVPEGLSSYIEKIYKELKHTKVHLNTAIQKLEQFDVDGKTKYKLLTQDGYVVDTEGKPIIYDKIIIATPANVTAKLLEGTKESAVREACELVEFYPTIIRLERKKIKKGDLSCREEGHDPDTVVHTDFDGVNATMTVYKDFKAKQSSAPQVHVVKRWILEGQPQSENCYAEARFLHTLPNEKFLNASQAMIKAQGRNGLFYASGETDSHESAVRGGLKAAALLCKEANCLKKNKTLALFPEIVQEVRTSAAIMTQATSPLLAGTSMTSTRKPSTKKADRSMEIIETSALRG